MRESLLITNVNRKMPKEIHHQSMTFSSMTQNGTPDRYYDGPARDLWVEYKYIDAMPRSRLVGMVHPTKRGCYSPQQYEWMLRRYNHSASLPHGPNVIGVVGLPNRTAVIQTTPTEWREGSSISHAVPLKEVTFWIADFCSRFSVSSAPSS